MVCVPDCDAESVADQEREGVALAVGVDEREGDVDPLAESDVVIVIESEAVTVGDCV